MPTGTRPASHAASTGKQPGEAPNPGGGVGGGGEEQEEGGKRRAQLKTTHQMYVSNVVSGRHMFTVNTVVGVELGM